MTKKVSVFINENDNKDSKIRKDSKKDTNIINL